MQHVDDYGMVERPVWEREPTAVEPDERNRTCLASQHFDTDDAVSDIRQVGPDLAAATADVEHV
jgi:hypothetical protein